MKPTIPQGTRDFDAATVRRRQYIFNTIRDVFELYGFQPLETPAMENLDTLMGKYGEEGDKLIFKILNNGLDNPNKAEKIADGFRKITEGKLSKDITERALRYDLTIPFARYVAMNYNQLPMPFKRYQMQPVWRADRPQKGRYREFYQCDADVVGSTSLLNELELVQLYATVFGKLNVPVEICINNRKVLAALANICGGASFLTAITVAIDKLDKIGIDKVKEELVQSGLSAEQVSLIESFLNISGTNEDKISRLRKLFANNEIGLKGSDELAYLSQRLNKLSYPNAQFVIDLTLARGLNYYTGTILEVKALGVQIGSIGGGGRYDDLTGLFGVPNVPGVGISFGVDRIYDVLTELDLFPEDIAGGAKILFFNLGESEAARALQIVQELRAAGIACEIFHEQAKFDKQFKYADKKGIPYIAVLGSRELSDGVVNIKHLSSGEQKTVPFAGVVDFMRSAKG
ncbi:MAG: histidine--tRNA ligase [Niabella sp.]